MWRRANRTPHSRSNALAVRNIAIACRQVDAHLVHFSTDYVFDGAAGRPYTELDAPHPLGAYAVSKLAGELFAQAYLDKPLIIRTSGVFGPGGLDTARGNFVELMLRLASSGQPIRVVEDHFASPAYTPWLAVRTADLVDKGLDGVFHIGGGVPVSWFEFARLIFQAAGLSPEFASHQRTRVPHRGAAAQVLGSLQRQDGGRRPGSHAVPRSSPARLLRTPPAAAGRYIGANVFDGLQFRQRHQFLRCDAAHHHLRDLGCRMISRPSFLSWAMVSVDVSASQTRTSSLPVFPMRDGSSFDTGLDAGERPSVPSPD